MSGELPQVVVLAGANGAGKTTASRSLLAETLGMLTFVNADVIAQGLAGFDPASVTVEASRIMLARLRDLAGQQASFAFETTLAARSYAAFLRELREAGYFVRLYYFWVDSADLAVARGAQRVRVGGHHVPEADIRQRYARSIRNFFTLYRPLADVWEVYDNSAQSSPRLLARGDGTMNEVIVEAEGWQVFRRMAE